MITIGNEEWVLCVFFLKGQFTRITKRLANVFGFIFCPGFEISASTFFSEKLTLRQRASTKPIVPVSVDHLLTPL